MCAGVIDKNASHQLSRNPKKLRSIPPIHSLLIEDFEIKLVYQSSGLQGVFATFMAEITRREPVQFIVDERHQFLECFLIAVGPSFE